MQTTATELDQILDAARPRMLALDESGVVRPSIEGKWSRKEILGHLIDSAANNHQRFVRSQFSDDLIFMGYKQDDWVRVQNYIDEPWTQLVQLWRHYNLHLLHVMAAVPEATRTQLRRRHNLDQVAWETVSQDEPTSLDFFMRDYIGHLQHHLQQVWERQTKTGTRES